MRRIRLDELKQILKAGDWVGVWNCQLELVLTVTDDGFTYGKDKIPSTATFDLEKSYHKSYWWVPGEMIKMDATIRDIKKQRKTQKESI